MNIDNQRIRVGVIRGGPSSEYDVSLKSGSRVLSALRGPLVEHYIVHDILIDKAGKWHIDGVPISIEDLSNRLDVVFNALHGKYGEDGTIQSIFEVHGVPFTGSGSVSSAIGMNKVLSKKAFENYGIKTVIGREILSKDIEHDPEKIARELFNTFPIPAIVKPVSGGSSIGMSIARTQKDLSTALIEASKHGQSVLVEEFIQGTEVTVGVIENFRGKKLYVLPSVEIKPHNLFFDYEAKYKGKSEEIVPARISFELKEKLEDMAKNAHTALGLRHYSRSDFIIHSKRGIYIIETNTLPGLTEESLIPKALKAVGSDIHELVHHLIGLAVGRDKYQNL